MRQQRVLLQFFKRGSGIVVIHECPQLSDWWIRALYSSKGQGASNDGTCGRARRQRTAGRENSGSGGRCGQKLVAVDLGGNSKLPIRNRFNTHNLTATADVNITSLRDLLRQRDHEFDFAADLERLLRKEIKSLVADVASLRA